MPHVTKRSSGGLMRVMERAFWLIGGLAFGFWLMTSITNRTAARAEIDRFTAAYPAAATLPSPTPRPAPSTRPFNPPSTLAAPDFQLWSPGRIKAWHSAQSLPQVVPLAILRVARLHVEAAVLEGTDDAALDRGLGHIEDTAAPGADGNVGIAGHRDGFFRALKDIAIGDEIELVTPAGPLIYRVARTWIVTPADVWVLDSTPAPAITLVTCYPFHYVGSAPQRFVVRAVRAGATVSADRSQ